MPTLWTIGYQQREHRRELGTPLEIRGRFLAGHLEDAAAARSPGDVIKGTDRDRSLFGAIA